MRTDAGTDNQSGTNEFTTDELKENKIKPIKDFIRDDCSICLSTEERILEDIKVAC